jgi:hypothetical protein
MTDPLTPLIAGGVGALLSQLAQASGLDVWQATVGNRLGAYQAVNGMKTARKLYDEAKRLGLTFDPNRVPDRFAFAWFKEAPEHDDDDIQTLFARLMARAGAEHFEDHADVRLISLLSRLTPIDATVFLDIYSDRVEPGPRRGVRQDTSFSTGGDWAMMILTEALEIAYPGEAVSSLEYLLAQGLLASFEKRRTPSRAVSTYALTADRAKLDLGKAFRQLTDSTRMVTATSLGTRLYNAVRP